MPLSLIHLTDRTLIALGGADAERFLQGLVSCDVRNVSATHASLGALLSPQGKFLFDFFLLRDPERGGFLLDTEASRAGEFIRKLSLYRLRAEVTLEEEHTRQVWALLGEPLPASLPVLCVPDPRHPDMGLRLYATEDELRALAASTDATSGTIAEYEARRLTLALPEGTKDAVVEKTLLLENGYDIFGGVDFTKGCYVGQEVTNRSKRRGELRKYLFTVTSEQTLPPPGTEILAEAHAIGSMRSSHEGIGLALLRTDLLAEAQTKHLPLTTGGRKIEIHTPWWHSH